MSVSVPKRAAATEHANQATGPWRALFGFHILTEHPASCRLNCFLGHIGSTPLSDRRLPYELLRLSLWSCQLKLE